MERRVTLHKHKGDSTDASETSAPQSSPNSAITQGETEETKSPLTVTSKEANESISESISEGSTLRRRVCKRISHEQESGKRRRISTGSGTVKTVSSITKKKRTTSLSSDKIRQCSGSTSDICYSETDKKVKERLKLKTDSAYYTIIGSLDSCWPASDPDDVKPEDQVQVPRWREKPLAPCYVMEGTENLGDDVFSKRHQRLETDERRRKR